MQGERAPVGAAAAWSSAPSRVANRIQVFELAEGDDAVVLYLQL